jgi:hypothetical protein
MTIMTVVKLVCPNTILNRVFQCTRQFCLDFRISFCRFCEIHYFVGFLTSFTLILSMVENVMFGFLSMFFMFFIFISCRTLFVHFHCCFACLVGVGGWGSGASVWVIVCVVRLADCGSRLGTYVYEVHCCERCV